MISTEFNEEELKNNIIKTAKSDDIKFISLQFVDILGNAKNCEVTTRS